MTSGCSSYKICLPNPGFNNRVNKEQFGTVNLHTENENEIYL